MSELDLRILLNAAISREREALTSWSNETRDWVKERADLRAQLTAERERVTVLLADLDRANSPWSVQLCYDDGCYPFNREDLKIVDIGVSDRVFIVASEKVDVAFVALNSGKE